MRIRIKLFSLLLNEETFVLKSSSGKKLVLQRNENMKINFVNFIFQTPSSRRLCGVCSAEQ